MSLFNIKIKIEKDDIGIQKLLEREREKTILAAMLVIEKYLFVHKKIEFNVSALRQEILMSLDI